MELAYNTKLVHGGKKEGTFALRTKAFFRRIEAGFWTPFSHEFRAGAHLKRAKLLLEAYERSGKERHGLTAEAAIERALKTYAKAGREKLGISAQGLLEKAECLLLHHPPASGFALEDLRNAYGACVKAVDACGGARNEEKETMARSLELLKGYASKCANSGIPQHTLAGFAYGYAAEFAPDSMEKARLHYEAFNEHLKSNNPTNTIAACQTVLGDDWRGYHGIVRAAMEELSRRSMEPKASQG